ncbi:hypothetical protein [Epinotia aporema granulovirus]|uniref:Uncharacterized protein n=1 Tax=Epinotia aporema granulovirus TaxID=166056 RepID=K4ERT6_9BBAC|nr:hypothetical protein [Epinotia aporema granulovirus]AER41450.1 hypothetical protein [Epinotia aporema granulovirus]
MNILRNACTTEPTIKGGLVLKALMGEPQLGDLDAEIKVSKDWFEKVIFMYPDQIRRTVRDDYCNLKNYDFDFCKNMGGLVESFKLEDYFSKFIFFSNYNQESFEFASVDTVNEINGVSNCMSVIDNAFLLYRFYLDCTIRGRIIHKRGDYSTEKDNIRVKCYFLDIVFNPGVSENLKIMSVMNTQCIVPSIDVLLYDQIHSCFVNLMHNDMDKVERCTEKLQKLWHISKPAIPIKVSSENFKRLVLIPATVRQIRDNAHLLIPIMFLQYIIKILQRKNLIQLPHDLSFYKNTTSHVLKGVQHQEVVVEHLCGIFNRVPHSTLKDCFTFKRSLNSYKRSSTDYECFSPKKHTSERVFDVSVSSQGSINRNSNASDTESETSQDSESDEN